MAKSNKPEQKSAGQAPKANNPAPKPAASRSNSAKYTSDPVMKPGVFVFGKINYILMAAGIVVIAVGFALMSGGATKDPNVFPADEIYSARRITVAPIVVCLGFLIEVFAIMIKPSATQEEA